VVTLVLIPSAIAYADLAKCPSITGLYAALGGMVAFALLTSSRHVIVGPDAAVAIQFRDRRPEPNGEPCRRDAPHRLHVFPRFLDRHAAHRGDRFHPDLHRDHLDRRRRLATVISAASPERLGGAPDFHRRGGHRCPPRNIGGDHVVVAQGPEPDCPSARRF